MTTGYRSVLRDSIDASSDSSLDGVRRKLTFEQNGIFGLQTAGSDGNRASDEFELPWDQY